MFFSNLVLQATMTTYFNYLPEELQKELRETAKALVAPGKG
jgi:hypothetical protein